MNGQSHGIFHHFKKSGWVLSVAPRDRGWLHASSAPDVARLQAALRAVAKRLWQLRVGRSRRTARHSPMPPSSAPSTTRRVARRIQGAQRDLAPTAQGAGPTAPPASEARQSTGQLIARNSGVDPAALVAGASISCRWAGNAGQACGRARIKSAEGSPADPEIRAPAQANA